MYKLFFAWLSFRKGDNNSDSPNRKGKIIDTCIEIWSALPWSGRFFLGYATALFFWIIVEDIFPTVRINVFSVSFLRFLPLLISGYFFLMHSRNRELLRLISDHPDYQAKEVAMLLLENDIYSLQDFDAAVEWCDELIYPRKNILNRFKQGGATVLVYLIGVITTSSSQLSDNLFLPFVFEFCVFVFVLVLAGVPENLFKILDKAAPIQMSDLQDFRRDLLMSKLEFMKLIRRQEITKPVKRFYEEVISKGVLDLLEGCISEHFTIREGENSRLIGTSGVRNYIKSLRHVYPGLSIQVLRMHVADATVISEISISIVCEHLSTNTHPNESPIVIQAVNIDRIIDGLIVEHYSTISSLETMMPHSSSESVNFQV